MVASLSGASAWTYTAYHVTLVDGTELAGTLHFVVGTAQREDRSLRGPPSQASFTAQREDRSLRGPPSQASFTAQREDRSLRGPPSQASFTAEPSTTTDGPRPNRNRR